MALKTKILFEETTDGGMKTATVRIIEDADDGVLFEVDKDGIRHAFALPATDRLEAADGIAAVLDRKSKGTPTSWTALSLSHGILEAVRDNRGEPFRAGFSLRLAEAPDDWEGDVNVFIEEGAGARLVKSLRLS